LQFDQAFQEQLAAHFLRDDVFVQTVGSLIEPSYFDNETLAALVSIQAEYIMRYQRCCTLKTFVQVLQRMVAAKRVQIADMAEAKRLLTIIHMDPLADRDFVIDTIADFARMQALSNGTLVLADALDSGNKDTIDKALEVVAAAKDVGAADAQQATDYKNGLAERLAHRAARAAGTLSNGGISTGSPELDNLLTPHGGWGRKELSILMGPPKSGKCVKRDTLILTEDGLVEIGDYVPDDLPVDKFLSKKISVLGRTGMEQTSHVYNSGLSKTIKVVTSKGLTIEGTQHHPMLVVDANGDHVWKNLSELAVGDCMIVQRGMRVFGSKVDLTYAINDAHARVNASNRPDAMTYPNLPKYMTEDLATFLGMIISEGYMGGTGVVSFTQKCPVVMQKYVALVSNLFCITPTIQKSKDKVPSARFQNVIIQAYLESLGAIYTPAAGKTMPKSIRSAPHNCVRAFMSAVLGLEGHVKVAGSKVAYEVTMASERIIQQLQVMLLNYGVVSRIKRKDGCATNGLRITRPYYRLSVSGVRNIAILRDDIGLIEKRKQEALSICENSDATARDYIPNAASKIGLIIEEIRAAGLTLKGDMNASLAKSICRVRSWAEGRQLTYHVAEQLQLFIDTHSINGPGSKWLRDSIAFGYAYDSVVELSEGLTETVDLTVPGTHSFFANGLISHNTAGLLNFAVAAAAAGNRVYYASCEVSEAILGDRMDANISGVPLKELETRFAEVQTEVNKWSGHPSTGELVIEAFPIRTLKVSQLKRILKRFEAQGKKFDLIVVDYGDILAPERNETDKRHELAKIYQDLRALGTTMDAAILTATQTNREGTKKASRNVTDGTDAAEDYEKVRTADALITINASPDDRANGEVVLYFSEMRNAESGLRVRFKQDISCMRFITTFEGLD
jgi:intein/homing endonuclease